MKSVPDHSDLYLVLLDLRNTSSRDSWCSPAQGIFERRTKTCLPALGNVSRPRYAEKVKENLHYRKGRGTQCYKKGCKELSKLHEGDFVYMRPQGNEKLLSKDK